MKATRSPSVVPDQRQELSHQFRRVRATTESLCAPLAAEDCVVQSMPEASPTKWHMAHTSWFFETFVLRPHASDYAMLEPRYEFLFNSYYNAVGAQFPRVQRGHLSRPTLEDVRVYRRHVDEGMASFLETAPERVLAAVAPVVELGLNHEEQHQELILTDVKHVLGMNPLTPPYRSAGETRPRRPSGESVRAEWVDFDGGIVAIGHDGAAFAFDNERPHHQVLLQPFTIADRLVTCGEYLAFVDDGGYERVELWLSDGWEACKRLGWKSPLYWVETPSGWVHYTLDGVQPVNPNVPVCHVSYYEADAFARWRGARLPLETEWEAAAGESPLEGNLLESGVLQPVALAGTQQTLAQLFGDVWEWTASPYVAYPGYAPPAGALGEYNGKFMCNQMVLRGASCVTPGRHVRRTYRNFFPPETRWQFSGIRLAR